MGSKALTLVCVAAVLVGCGTTDGKVEKRIEVAAASSAAATAQIPRLTLPEVCKAHIDFVILRDEPWVIFKRRWEDAAKNRNLKADDCGLWEADYNSRVDALNQKGAQ